MRLTLLLFGLVLCGCTVTPESTSTRSPARDPETRTRRHELGSPDTVVVCLSQEGGVQKMVKALSYPGTKEIVLQSPDSGFAYLPAPPPYADTLGWFVQRAPISFGGRAFYWNGTPRQLTQAEIAQVGRNDGITLYAEGDYESAGLGILFVPVSPGCAFQPYYHFTSPKVQGGTER